LAAVPARGCMRPRLYAPAVVHQQARALCARRVPRGCAS